METSASTLFHTLRHLRGVQISGQLRRRVERWLERPERFGRRPAPAFPGCRSRPGPGWPPPRAPRSPEALLAGRFEFLNDARQLGWPPRWQVDEAPALWRYNLHYHDFLWALAWSDAAALARDWIAAHPLGRGRIGWDPYPISLRLQNWCGYFFGRHAQQTEADAALREELWASLHLQACWLEAHLETHLLGNHLLENAATLALLGACFEGPEAERFGVRGRALLAAQLREQILADGGHFERSPMYQARVVQLLAALASCGDPRLAALVTEPLRRSLAALGRLVHPDGGIALLNDSALGIQPTYEALLHALSGPSPAPEEGAFALPESGYYGAREPDGRYLVCDAGPIGPDYLPGHAHGDLFSFELSLGGERVIVDAGVFGYDADELRRYCRSTAAHNTVEVEGRDQCEFWAAFRVGRRGRPRDVVFEALDDGFRLAGWHDGYLRLQSRARHARELRWYAGGLLLVRDRVEARRPVRCVSRLHLAPGCELLERHERGVHLRHPGGELRVAFAGEGSLSVEPSRYCPEFGRCLEGTALCFSHRASTSESGFCIAEGSSALAYDLVAGARVEGRRYTLGAPARGIGDRGGT